MAKSRKTQISAMLRRRSKHQARRKEVVIRKKRNERLPEYVPPKVEEPVEVEKPKAKKRIAKQSEAPKAPTAD